MTRAPTARLIRRDSRITAPRKTTGPGALDLDLVVERDDADVVLDRHPIQLERGHSPMAHARRAPDLVHDIAHLQVTAALAGEGADPPQLVHVGLDRRAHGTSSA